MRNEDKIRENRLRRMAERQGLRLSKNGRRDPRAYDYGSYMLVNENNVIVADFGWDRPRSPEGTSWLDDIETYLTSDPDEPAPETVKEN